MHLLFKSQAAHHNHTLLLIISQPSAGQGNCKAGANLSKINLETKTLQMSAGMDLLCLNGWHAQEIWLSEQILMLEALIHIQGAEAYDASLQQIWVTLHHQTLNK